MKKLLLSLLCLMTLVVANAATIGDKYSKVTSTSDLSIDAEYILCYDTNAMGAQSGKFRLRVANGVSLEGGVATIKSVDVAQFTIVNGTEAGTYAFEFGNGSFLQCTSTSNNSLGEVTKLAENCNLKITIANGIATIIPTKNSNSDGNKIQYNKNSGQERFSNYKTGTQQNCTLYKKVTDEPVDPDATARPVITFDELTNKVSITCETAGASIYYTLDGNNPTAESALYGEPFEVTKSCTVKAIAIKDGKESSVASQEITVIDPNAPGTVNNPYTVAQALEACADAPQNVYVKGIVTKVTTVYSEQYSNVTYNIADEANGTEILEVYRGKWGADVTAPADKNPEVGATVIVKGDLQVYNSKKQFAKDSQIVSYTAPENPGPVLLPAGLEFSAAEHTVNVGETVDGLALTKPEDNTGVVTYTSSDEAIATVNAETGAVTGVAAGTVTITATSTATDTYKAGEASYTLTVVDPNAPVELSAMFDFTTNPAYGLESTTSSYESEQKIIDNGIVSLTLSGSYRLTSFNGAHALRLHASQNNAGKGKMTISVPEDYYITEIEFGNGSTSYNAIVLDNAGTISNNKWTFENQMLSSVSLERGSSNPSFNTITVKYAKMPPSIENASITITHGTYDGEVIVDYAFTIAYHNGHDLIVEASIDGMDDIVFGPEEENPAPAAAPARVAGENPVTGRLVATHDKLKGAIKPQIRIKATLDGNELYNDIHEPTITTGVDDILTDDANAPVEYYNLQGVRVANPESGLYIRVQGKKATKVLVK